MRTAPPTVEGKPARDSRPSSPFSAASRANFASAMPPPAVTLVRSNRNRTKSPANRATTPGRPSSGNRTLDPRPRSSKGSPSRSVTERSDLERCLGVHLDEKLGWAADAKGGVARERSVALHLEALDFCQLADRALLEWSGVLTVRTWNGRLSAPAKEPGGKNRRGESVLRVDGPKRHSLASRPCYRAPRSTIRQPSQERLV